jgi:hypothetical protein
MMVDVDGAMWGLGMIDQARAEWIQMESGLEIPA